MAGKKPGRDVAVGAMFALALIILALTIMALGDGSNLFRSQVFYHVIFPSVEGMFAARLAFLGPIDCGIETYCLSMT